MMKRKIAAIMAADIAEYTRIVAEDEEEAIARLATYRQVFDEFVVRAGGRVFNTSGDGVMCEFPSAVEATRCAIDIQESLRTHNLAYPPGRQMHFRIGIAIGDVVDRDGDLLGDGVNIAARLQGLAEPGSLCVARNVQEAIANKMSVSFRDLGRREVKNLPYPVHAFQIAVGGLGAKVGGRRIPGRWAVPSSARWLAAGMAIAAGGAGLYWLGRAEQARTPITVMALLPTAPEPGAADRAEALTPAQAFERLARAGGLLREPSTAAEFYHNARLFEARGESANARQAYLALAALGGEHIDPLLRLAALIRAQDGRAGAREIFAELAAGPSRAARAVHAQQFDGAERLRRIATLAEQEPRFGPIHALLAIEFGEDRQNTQTIEEKRRERAAIARFLAADREGELVPYFLDQSVLAQWLDRAQRRAEPLAAFFTEQRDAVSAQFSRNNAGWLASIVAPEPATLLEYRIGDAREFQSTGFLQVADPRTGRPMPSPSFTFPPETGPTSIALRYADANGAPSPVTTLAFDPRIALARGLREQLERMPQAWLSFTGSAADLHVNYVLLVSHRCTIERVEIGFNGQEPTRQVTLPPCDPANPFVVPNPAAARLALRPEIRSVSLRLTFIGGDQSALLSFARPD